MPSPSRAYPDLPSQADLFYFCTTLSTSEEDLNLRYAPPSKSSMKVGVLVLGPDQIQLSDLAVVDILAMIGRNRLSRLHAPTDTLDQAVDELDIRYVSESGEGSFSVTSGTRMPVTNSFENAPQFDVLIIPGTFSLGEIPLPASAFLAIQTSVPIVILSIASGILNLVQTGLLHQRRATGPPSLLPTLRQRYPDTTWPETRWTRHDDIWTSSSAITAIDMVTAWMREYFWDRSDAVEFALSAAGITRLQDYVRI
ncbi:class I glutamine amidotransferase-like protein [Amniculicola lignicola CBS 123094]|uniref:Class I glutamine amidotransferase-like protein n=1 Tax=Amniculicola lignicola CBS 123094 TaxID=1392246 RepID=A0A6A5W6J0_9PLEO|nr:class I glutamine amidotransferase-like protein [Amniculicola lignicola CBS 123094]